MHAHEKVMHSLVFTDWSIFQSIFDFWMCVVMWYKNEGSYWLHCVQYWIYGSRNVVRCVDTSACRRRKIAIDCTVEKLKHKTVSIWFKNSLLCGAMWNSGYSRQGTPNPSINWGKGEREYVTFRRFVQLENNIVNVTQLVIPYMVM